MLNKARVGTQTALDAVYRIFPRHHGAENVFDSERLDPKQANFAAWGMPTADRGRKGGAVPKPRLGKRLIHFLPIWERVLKHHQTTNYRALLDFHCVRDQSVEDVAGCDNFLNLASSTGRVVGFVRSVVKRVFRLEIWGSEANQAVILAGKFGCFTIASFC